MWQKIGMFRHGNSLNINDILYISALCSERFIHVHFFVLFCFVALISQSSGEAEDLNYSTVKYLTLLYIVNLKLFI